MTLSKKMTKEEQRKLNKALMKHLLTVRAELAPVEFLEILDAINDGCYKSMWDLQTELDMEYGINPYDEELIEL